MAWQTPKTNWQAADVVRKDDFNRIEGNIQHRQDTKETPAGAQAKAEAAAGAVQAELDSHLANYAQRSVTMGHENDLYVAKISPLLEFTSLAENYGGTIYAIATYNEFVYVGGEIKTVKVIENCELIKIIRRYQ